MNLCIFTEKIRINFVQTLVNQLIEEKAELIILKGYANIVGKHLFLGSIRNEDFAAEVVRLMQEKEKRSD